MSAEFENGIFSGRKPAWHGLGIVADEDTLTLEQILERVPELGSDVIAEPLYTMALNADGVGPMKVPGYTANVRQLDGRVLGIGGSDYQIVQNREMFAFAEAIIDEADSTEAGFIAATSLYDGRRATATLRLPGEIMIAGDAGERHLPFLNVANSFDGSMALVACVSWIRVVCANTLQASLASAPRRFSLRHTTNVGSKVAEARRALGLTYRLGDEWETLANRLIQEPFSQSDFERLVKKDLMPEHKYHKETDRRLSNLHERQDLILANYLGSDTLEKIRDTKWGALNAVSEFEQHVAYENRSADRKLAALYDDGPLFAKTLKVLA